MLRRLGAVSFDPVRLDIIEVLRFNGPTSYPDLRRLVPEAASGLMGHLRELGEGQWIDKVSGDGRAGVWAARGPGVKWDEAMSRDDPELASAVDQLMWTSSVRRMAKQRAWRQDYDRGVWSREWIDSWIGLDYTFDLTPAELGELDRDLTAVFAKFRARSEERRAVVRASDPAHHEVTEESAPVFVAALGFPVQFGGRSVGRKKR